MFKNQKSDLYLDKLLERVEPAVEGMLDLEPALRTLMTSSEFVRMVDVWKIKLSPFHKRDFSLTFPDLFCTTLVCFKSPAVSERESSKDTFHKIKKK